MTLTERRRFCHEFSD